MRKLFMLCAGLVLVGSTVFANENEMDALKQKVAQLEAQMSQTQVSPMDAAAASSSELNVYWKTGLRADSEDGAFKIKFGGRAMWDWAWIDQDNDIEAMVGDYDDGVEVRRARIYFAGKIYDRVGFKTQYDLAGGDADFKDFYMSLLDIGPGDLMIGHFFEPFGLETQSSSKYITFMEVGLPDALCPGRNQGIAYIADGLFDGMIGFGLGLFRPETNDYADEMNDTTEDSEYAVAARVYATLLNEQDTDMAKVVHLGLSYRYCGTEDDSVRFRARPETHQGNRFVDTGNIADSDNYDTLGLEAAFVYGPFSLQTEYVGNWVDSDQNDDPHFWGWYIYASYFITGESRPYADGNFGRVMPKANFLSDGGMGAWEVALRYSRLDLDDEDVSGGDLQDVTVGLNWYLNPNTRIMANYVWADVEYENADDGDADIFQMRFQFDF